MLRGLMGGRRSVPEFRGPARPLRSRFTYAVPGMFAHHPEASLPAHVATGAGQAKRFLSGAMGRVKRSDFQSGAMGRAKRSDFQSGAMGRAKRSDFQSGAMGQGVGALAHARPLDPLPVPTGMGEKEEG